MRIRTMLLYIYLVFPLHLVLALTLPKKGLFFAYPQRLVRWRQPRSAVASGTSVAEERRVSTGQSPRRPSSRQPNTFEASRQRSKRRRSFSNDVVYVRPSNWQHLAKACHAVLHPLVHLFHGVFPLRVITDVVVVTLASSRPIITCIAVGVGVILSCTVLRKHKLQALRITVEVVVLRYLNALPGGVGVASELRSHLGNFHLYNFGGALVHLGGQRACAAFVSILASKVGINIFEANGLLLASSYIGNSVLGNRLFYVGEAGSGAYQLMGFFSRKRFPTGIGRILSLPFDLTDTLLGGQGILSATERELTSTSSPLGAAFREWAARSGNILDAHSLGTIGARHLKEMGLIQASVRLFARPFFSIGWTAGSTSMCMEGDIICGGRLAKILDPSCCLLPGHGHIFSKYMALMAATAATVTAPLS